MIQAFDNHKISSEIRGQLWNSEDAKTSSIIGTLSLLPAQQFWTIIRRAEWYEKLNARCTETEIDEARSNYDLCLRLYHEITEASRAVIRIDSRDFEYLFSDCNEVNAYECSIDGKAPQRMVKLVNMFKEKIGHLQCPCKLLLYLFAPDKNDLLMSEMEAVNKWLNESFNNKEIRFGLGVNENSNEMRMAVMIQKE